MNHLTPNGDLIEENGSLQLWHDKGDDRNPETFSVCLAERPYISGSLQVANEFYEINDMRLSGSQVGTVKAWNEIYG